MKKDKTNECGCSCCSDSYSVLLGSKNKERLDIEERPCLISRGEFLKVIGLGAVGLSTIAGTEAFAKAEKEKGISVVKGKTDWMIVDSENKELRISATVTKDSSQPSVADWGRRFQAFFGTKGGKMEAFFVFTTDVSRAEIDKAIQKIGMKSRRQIPMEEVAKRRGLKPTTTREDYLEGDPVIVTVRFHKDGKIVESALEDLIDEKIEVEGRDVIKPYTPHFIYHGTAEAINFQSGCIVCPSDCNGGIITDNVLPLKHTVNYYKVMWDRMPQVGSKVEVVIKSIYGKYKSI
ncbi:MAG TPA: YdjY domain-containing protein [Dissulfurispiraceae bacterium]|nr:YdjY domain-containing protein [Dissulfurispiraceae bacterium]